MIIAKRKRRLKCPALCGMSRVAMRPFRAAVATFIFIFLPLTLSAQLAPEAGGFLGDLDGEAREELGRTGRLSRNFDNHRDLRYLPDHRMTRRLERSVRQVRPNVISEAVMYLDRGVSDEEFLSLYNAFRAVSELSYMEYYNPEKEVWNELFYDSYRIPDPGTNRPLPDPIATSIEGEDSFHVGQEIPPFGYIASEYSFESAGDAFLFSSTNVDRFHYRDVPVLGPERMITHVLVIRGDDYVLAYGVGGARVFTLFGILGGQIETPFQARTSALFDWFYQEHLEPLDR